jgi:hypothetical protein
MIVLLVLALISVWHWISSSAPSSAASPKAPTLATVVTNQQTPSGQSRILTRPRPNAKRPPSPKTLDPTLRFDLLRSSENREYSGGKRNIFEAEQIRIPTPIVPNNVAKVELPKGPPPPPPPPPINLKFYGFANKAGETKQIFLLSGDDVFLAREGEIVNRRYRVIRITNNSVEIEDVLNNNRQTIPLTQG